MGCAWGAGPLLALVLAPLCCGPLGGPLLPASAGGGGDGKYTRQLLQVPNGEDPSKKALAFAHQHLEPRHAVAVGVVAEGSKRHRLLEELANSTELFHLLAIGAQFSRAGSSLTVHRDHYPPVVYGGKWTPSALKAWLSDVAYGPVNRMNRIGSTAKFAPYKYLTDNPFGAVLIVKPVEEQSEGLVRAFEPYALEYRDRLKFTFFTKSVSTQQVCDTYGIWTNDELLLLEGPRPGLVAKKVTHTVTTRPRPKYRLESLTPARIDGFFKAYVAGTQPLYFRPANYSKQRVVRNGVRELSGWDFASTVADPNASVLVLFVSAGCDACEEFAAPYEEVARRVLKDTKTFGNLLVARIDQSANEHSERITGTPWMRYWPSGSRKKALDVELRTVAGILDFLEERAMEAEEEEL